jgi:hypothetical protein
MYNLEMRIIHHRLQIRTRISSRLPRHSSEIDIRLEGQLSSYRPQDLHQSANHPYHIQQTIQSMMNTHIQPVLLVWHVAQQSLIQPSRTQKRRINKVRSTGSCQDIHPVQALRTVHLCQELIHHSIRHPGRIMTT